MSRYLIHVRQSYRRPDDADVSEQQEAAAVRLLPKGDPRMTSFGTPAATVAAAATTATATGS